MACDLKKVALAIGDLSFANDYLDLLVKYVPDRFTIFYSGESLLNKIKEGTDEYGIVIIDKILFDMAGTQAIKEIKNLDPNVRLYLMTVAGESDDSYAGATGVLKKPVQVDDFKKIIDQFLNIA